MPPAHGVIKTHDSTPLSDEGASGCRSRTGVQLRLGTGAQILASVTDSSVRAWDTRTGELLYELREHKGDAFVLECHPTDSRIAISGAYDGTISMWDLSTGMKLARWAPREPLLTDQNVAGHRVGHGSDPPEVIVYQPHESGLARPAVRRIPKPVKIVDSYARVMGVLLQHCAQLAVMSRPCSSSLM